VFTLDIPFAYWFYLFSTLADFVSEVLNVAVPEVSNQDLPSGASFAVSETQTLNFIEHLRVLVAGYLRRRSTTKFIGAPEQTE
jgi:hypothetical protein